MWGKKEHLKEWGVLSAIREIEEYIYLFCLSFPGKREGEERKRDFDIVLPKLEKNFEVKVRLRITKTFRYKKKTQRFGVLLEGESGGKGVVGLQQ